MGEDLPDAGVRPVRIAETWEVEPGTIRRVEIPGHDAIALVRQDDRFFALSDRCTHGDASLADGELEEGQLFCPFHGGAFNVETGKATRYPCTEPLRCYKLEVRGEEIFAELDCPVGT